MPELYNKYLLRFPKGKQILFLDTVLLQTKSSKKELSSLIGISERYLRELWKEKAKISEIIAKRLSSLSGVKIPSNVQKIGKYDHTSEAGKLGMRAVMDKYGRIPVNENNRKRAWENWWLEIGSKDLNPILRREHVNIPKKVTADIAEMCGIIIGDGGISKRQIRITLNKVTDKKYSIFVKQLIYSIFKVRPKTYYFKKSKALDICVSRSELVDYFISLGMKLGNKVKQNVNIPKWIMINKKFRVACIRGMVDTDGSIYHEIHREKPEKYSYPRLNFVNASLSLNIQLYEILEDLGFNPKIRRRGRAVQLENYDEICEYLQVVGTHNDKHLKRFWRSGRVGRSHQS